MNCATALCWASFVPLLMRTPELAMSVAQRRRMPCAPTWGRWRPRASCTPAPAAIVLAKGQVPGRVVGRRQDMMQDIEPLPAQPDAPDRVVVTQAQVVADVAAVDALQALEIGLAHPVVRHEAEQKIAHHLGGGEQALVPGVAVVGHPRTIASGPVPRYRSHASTARIGPSIDCGASVSAISPPHRTLPTDARMQDLTPLAPLAVARDCCVFRRS